MSFSDVSRYLQELEETPSRNAMTATLAELFKRAGKGEIRKLCYLLQGRVAPLYDPIEFGIADKLMIRAVARAFGMDEDRVNAAFKESGDLGIAAERCASARHKGTRSCLTVREVFDRLAKIPLMIGEGSQEEKIDALSQLLASVDALSARYVVRIMLDKLRLGFSDMTILDALSWMCAGDKSLREKLEDAYSVRPDIGLLAQIVKEHGIGGLKEVRATVGVPLLASLCQRLPTADEMVRKMGTVAVEPKYDGVRVQIHARRLRDGSVSVQTFSRNLENTTAMFPELRSVARQLNACEAILDSEAVGVDPKTGRLIPFQETVTRKRKHEIAASLLKVPLRFFVFDILSKDGTDLLEKPLSERRRILEATVRKGEVLAVAPQIVTDSADAIRRFHEEQLKKGLEGAVVKKWGSPYEPGRRGFSWVKFKEEEGKTGKLTDTIDGVVMGYYRGEGKRAGFGIGAFLIGVKRGDTFVTLSKIGTGVSDELWKELEAAFRRHQSAGRPRQYAPVHKTLVPDAWVYPSMVVEVAGDDLTKSPTHGAGYAIRFPRLVRIRPDKSPQEATTVREVEELYRRVTRENV